MPDVDHQYVGSTWISAPAKPGPFLTLLLAEVYLRANHSYTVLPPSEADLRLRRLSVRAPEQHRVRCRDCRAIMPDTPLLVSTNAHDEGRAETAETSRS
jgi:hypothetical protein